MDAASKATWMYSCRPLKTLPLSKSWVIVNSNGREGFTLGNKDFADNFAAARITFKHCRFAAKSKALNSS